MTRPHLLYIAFSFPPSTASSVYRCTAVANAFIAAGWEVTVVTLSEEIWAEISGTDFGLVDSIDPRVRVVHVDDGGAEEPNRRDLRRYSRLRIEAPYLWKELFRRRHRADFPEDFHELWFAPASQAARAIHAERPADLVMASASPYISFKVAAQFGDVPYILDYRDAWAFNTFTGAENYAPDSKHGRLENDYLNKALQVWFVNEPIRTEYASRYPDAANVMRVVPNGFDPQPGHRKSAAHATNAPRFGYLGTLQYTAVPLDEFLGGWDLAFGGHDAPPARAVFRGKLSPSGLVPADVLDIFNSGVHHGLSYEGPISKRDVSNFYGTMDALLLLLPPGKYVTGGKTAEYLATGLPIISIHDPDSAATQLLRDYPLWFPATELTVKSIAQALLDCAKALAEPDVRRWDAAWTYGQQFARSNILNPAIAQLQALTGSGGSVPDSAPAERNDS
ncbi:glycosyltransferase [Specibacter sp. RAF43]|uniref:glycosyltransferase n=1 Tax=Specibacter sp. RAF43 TaxID=3233057 RepID=UPI003F9959E4